MRRNWDIGENIKKSSSGAAGEQQAMSKAADVVRRSGMK